MVWYCMVWQAWCACMYVCMSYCMVRRRLTAMAHVPSARQPRTHVPWDQEGNVQSSRGLLQSGALALHPWHARHPWFGPRDIECILCGRGFFPERFYVPPPCPWLSRTRNLQLEFKFYGLQHGFVGGGSIHHTSLKLPPRVALFYVRFIPTLISRFDGFISFAFCVMARDAASSAAPSA